VFTGADSALMDRDHGRVDDTTALRRDFLRDTPEQRRAVLLPFFWSAIARQGQIYGNPVTGSEARVTNGLKFSYPGYNELFTGAPAYETAEEAALIWQVVRAQTRPISGLDPELTRLIHDLESVDPRRRQSSGAEGRRPGQPRRPRHRA